MDLYILRRFLRSSDSVTWLAVRTPSLLLVTTLVSEKGDTNHRSSEPQGSPIHSFASRLTAARQTIRCFVEIHGECLTLLEIVRSRLPAAEYTFFSAGHTVELTEEMAGMDGVDLSDYFIFSRTAQAG